MGFRGPPLNSQLDGCHWQDLPVCPERRKKSLKIPELVNHAFCARAMKSKTSFA
jgi:hypothetical protein